MFKCFKSLKVNIRTFVYVSLFHLLVFVKYCVILYSKFSFEKNIRKPGQSRDPDLGAVKFGSSKSRPRPGYFKKTEVCPGPEHGNRMKTNSGCILKFTKPGCFPVKIGLKTTGLTS